MKKNTLSFLILIFGVLISGGIISFANAQTDNQTIPTISYPIVELGNCADKASCKAYCDKSENVDACLSFAEKNNLMKKEEINAAKKFKGTGIVGPGACKGKDACEQYCSDSNHLEECTSFAEKNGMMSNQQLKDSKKVIAAIKSGLKPPACSGPKQCNTYCSNPAHMEECMTFSIAAGIVQDNQKEQMQKTLEALKQGVKPPACEPNSPSDQLEQSGQDNQSVSGLPSCDQYCGTHQEECMTFSLATGMVPDSQKEQVQKTIKVLKQGIKPPACRPNPPSDQGGGGQGDNNQGSLNQSSKPDQSGLQSCDLYCADSSHVEECVKFSVAIGNMTEEQGQNSIKNGNKGPGGCVGKDACDTFCGNPDNQDACFNFAKDNGMISSEDLQKIQQGGPGQGGSMKPGQDKPGQQGGPDGQNNGKLGDFNQGQDFNQPNKPNQPNQFEQGGPRPGGPNQGQGFNPGSGVNGNGNGPGGGQGDRNEGNNNGGPGVGGPNEGSGPCGTGPGTCSGQGPDDLNSNKDNGGQGGTNQGKGFNQPNKPNQPNQPGPGGPNAGSPGMSGPGRGGSSGGPNQGQGFNPGSGVNGNGNGPGAGVGQGQIRPGQPGQQPNQPMQPNQPGQKGPGPGGPGQSGSPNQGQGGPGNNGGGGVN